jgi:N-acetylglucosaminyldiphosphoundecaprenol N-acetyl-beta-D-mannosaminyltransferase
MHQIASSTPSAKASELPIRRLFGLPFRAASLPEVRDHLLSDLDAGSQNVVVTPNTDHVIRLAHDEDLRALYARADVVVADGMPVVWASELLHDPLPGRVTGVDLTNALAAGLAERGAGVFVLGGHEGLAERAGAALVAANPGLRIAGTHHGYFDGTDDPDVIAAVNAADPAALLVGMGSPRQERWAIEHGAVLRPRIVLCVGGALEVLAGTRQRAPAWMQRSGLEWSYRLMQEPGRLWRRYLVEDAAFIPVVLAEWRSRRIA